MYCSLVLTTIMWTKVLGQICSFGAFALFTPDGNATSPGYNLPPPHYDVEKHYLLFFFWFSTWYLVGRGANSAFIRGKQRFAQISVVKHIQFVKLGKCPKDFIFHDCSSCNLKSLFFLSGMRLTAIPGFIVHWPSSNIVVFI